MTSIFDGVRILTFDCYGTLIDWESGILAALAPWLSRAGVDRPDDALLEAFGRAERAAESATPAALYPDVLRDTLARMAAVLGVPATDDERDAFAASVGDWPAFDDSPRALADLKSRFELGILSNVDRASFARSNERLGVDFDVICTAEDIGSYKPDPANFRYLLDRLGERGIDRAGVLHVAQSLHHDIEPARELGLACVWIDRRHAKSGFGATVPPTAEVAADAVFPSLAAFADAAR